MCLILGQFEYVFTEITYTKITHTEIAYTEIVINIIHSQFLKSTRFKLEK